MQYKLLLLMLFLSQSHLFHFITLCTTDAKKVSGSYLIYLFLYFLFSFVMLSIFSFQTIELERAHIFRASSCTGFLRLGLSLVQVPQKLELSFLGLKIFSKADYILKI